MTDVEELENLIAKHSKQSFIQDLYHQINNTDDNRFGEVSLWSKKEGEHLVLMKEESLDSLEECNEAIEFAKERMSMNYDYIMKMIDYSVSVRAKNHFQVAAYYEAPLQDLKREIEVRKLENR
jgi:hypothetical protein